MISTRSHFHLLKVTLEAQSAHAIHTGHGDTTHDSLVVRDANGLPTLVGSSLAGVLRHQYQQHYGLDKAQALFGFAKGLEGQNSWLNVAWGLVHNSQNKPHEGLLNQSELQDSLLAQLLNSKPIVRQRVRLTDKGVTEGAGKFDVTLMPAGVRYTTWISYWCDGSVESKTQWQNFVDLLTIQPIRIGKGTRNGYGLFVVQALYQGEWDLTTPEGCRGYSQRTRQRANHQGLNYVDMAIKPVNQVSASLSLQAESNWRVGGGEQHLEVLDKDHRTPDLLPMHESKIVWIGEQGSLAEQFYLLPASAIKGALRHRVSFHYNCLLSRFVDDAAAFDTDNSPAIKTLFGFTKDQDGHAGLLAFRDVYLTQQKVQVVMHNKIDRYTGGVMRGALFSEALLWKSNIEVRIDILQPHTAVDSTIKQALTYALEDLANGWLPLGASGSRGLGVFCDASGQGVVWSDQQQWIGVGEVG